jgi:hypothetical protein
MNADKIEIARMRRVVEVTVVNYKRRLIGLRDRCTKLEQHCEKLQHDLETLRVYIRGEKKDRTEYFQRYYQERVKPCHDKMEKKREKSRLWNQRKRAKSALKERDGKD